MKRPLADATVLVDDKQVRMTRFDFVPGAETGWHEHEMDYVVTPVTQCQMLLEDPQGQTREVTLAPGAGYKRPKGVRHNVINNGDKAMCFVEVELK